MPRNGTTAVRRGARRATPKSTRKFEIVPIFKVEANIPLLRAYRKKNPARFKEWADYVKARLKMMLNMMATVQSEEMGLLVDPELTMTGCKVGRTYSETMKDGSGEIWVRTCMEYWCQNPAGDWQPDGVKCSNWTHLATAGMEIVIEPEHLHSAAGNGHEQFDPPSRNRGGRNGRG